MLSPRAELAPTWRRPGLRASVVTDYYKGPDIPAGYTFFGRPVYRTLVQFMWPSSPTVPFLIPGFGGLVDIVDVQGGARGSVTGAVEGHAQAQALVMHAWNGASALRFRIDPTVEDTLEFYGNLNEFGASESWPLVNTVDAELLIFWTK